MSSQSEFKQTWMKRFVMFFDSCSLCFVIVLSLHATSTQAATAIHFSTPSLCREVFIGDVNSSGMPLPLRNKSHNHKDLEILNSLISKGLITISDRDNLLENGKIDKIISLRHQGLISEAILEAIFENFGPIFTGPPRGPLKKVLFILRDPNHPDKNIPRWTYIQEMTPDMDGTYLTLIDPQNQRAFARIHFSIFKDILNLESIEVLKVHRNFGYSSELIKYVLDQNPHIKTIKAQLASINHDAMLAGIQSGLNKEKAFENTPLYKSISKIGYTKININIEYSFNKAYYDVEISK